MKIKIGCASERFSGMKDEYMKSDHIVKKYEKRLQEYVYYFVGTNDDLIEYSRQIGKPLVFKPKESKPWMPVPEDSILIYDDYIE